MRLIYSCFFYLITPLLLLKLWRRGKQAPAYRQRIGERFGFAEKTSETAPLWVHAVSVGEVVAITPVLKQLLVCYPELPILVTTSTPTGADRVAKLFKDFPQLWHQYCPYDQPGAVSRFLTRQRPLGLLIVETELWPNMLAKCAARGIPVMLANGRMSEKSAAGYAKVSVLSKPMLRQISLLVAQYKIDGDRFTQLGLPAENLLISGSIKFDLEIDAKIPAKVQLLREQIGARPVLILGSSHESEEYGVLEQMAALWQSQPNLLLIIVPRHPERFKAVAELAGNYSSQVLKRSESAPNKTCQIYIGDTMGELGMLYAVADVAIVGGSFISVGGQNPIEPASVATAVLMGPEQYNFSVICPALEAAGGMRSVADYAALQVQLQALFAAPERITAMSNSAKAHVESQRGATQILLHSIERVLLATLEKNTAH
ncbi:MAG: lipid IV(A) 3-deoxy-D-manno-octulosonic acid transferase [Oceanospirillaceae bacterium]|nr:lipid IV(A) 3-deoxy-D-manno-octulosonic acid transferase [Oceanospirillaceae bacterium]